MVGNGKNPCQALAVKPQSANPLKIAGYRRKNKFEKNLKKVLQCAENVSFVGIIASCY